MKISGNSILTLAKDTLIEIALKKEENRYKEDVYLMYNPLGYGGIISVGVQVVDLVSLFDGVKNVENVISEFKLSHDIDENIILKTIDSLFQKQFLYEVGKEIVKSSFRKELTCWLHLTNDCNLRCKYCYIHKSHENMSDEILYKSIDKMLDSCRKHGYETLSLMLVGGEPLTRFDKVKDIISYCTLNKGNINVRYIIPTNGTLITNEMAKYLHENNVSVGISIDGTEQYHDKNRINIDGKGSYKKAMEGVDILIENNIKPSIMVTVTNDNLEGLPSITKVLIDKGLFFRFSFERDTSTGNPSILQDEKKVIDILKKCFEIMKNEAINSNNSWRFQFGDTTFSRPCRRACAAGRNFFSIGQNGEIGSCSLGLENPRGNISEIEDVIPDIERIFSDIGHTSACDVEECKNCIWRHSCAGACPLQTYATYNTYLHTSPYCRIYKECLLDVIRVYAINIYYNMKKEEK